MVMDDDLNQLEQVLRDRAAEVPHVQDVPPTMLGRARRRVARNAVASVRVRGSNACPQLSGPVSWKIDLGNGAGTLDPSSADASFVPPCNGPTEPSTLEVGPFEPSAGA